jgi:hypothetical protein
LFGNSSRRVDDPQTRGKIIATVQKWVER